MADVEFTVRGFTADELRSAFEYDPATGEFTNRVQRGHALRGQVAGTITAAGYRVLRLNRKNLGAHRVAYLIHFGHVPAEIDHINMVKSDNRIANLRPASRAENVGNTVARKSNKLGIKGVSAVDKGRRFRARIVVAGREIRLGIFDTPEQASQAYAEAAKKFFGGYARS